MVQSTNLAVFCLLTYRKTLPSRRRLLLSRLSMLSDKVAFSCQPVLMRDFCGPDAARSMLPFRMASRNRGSLPNDDTRAAETVLTAMNEVARISTSMSKCGGAGEA